MKQILTFAIAASAALTAAGEYTALTFKTAGGDDHSIALKDLAISFSDENLTAYNRETSISLPLARVESMEFTDGASVDAVGGDRLMEQTTVFDLAGKRIGCFRSFHEAMSMLPEGIYLFIYTDGTTLKISKK